MANRIRNERLEIKLTKGRKGSFWGEKKTCKVQKIWAALSANAFLEKEIYQVDLDPFRDLQGLLSNATNNINQIAKRVNQTGIIYKDDIQDMKKRLNIFQKSCGKFTPCLWKELLKLKGNDNGDYKKYTLIKINPSSCLSTTLLMEIKQMNSF